MAELDYVFAHQNSKSHREEVENSDLCGCYYCLHIFKPSEIVEWIDDETTALCPHCGIDSVIGQKSGYPITAEFLQRMNEYWFEE